MVSRECILVGVICVLGGLTCGLGFRAGTVARRSRLNTESMCEWFVGV